MGFLRPPCRAVSKLLVLSLLKTCARSFSYPPAFHGRTVPLSLGNFDEDAYYSFEDLGLGSEVLSAVRSQVDWITPTPIQQLAIPQLVSGSSNAVWCEAPTGGGKTACYVLPLLQNLLKARTAKGGKVASLVLCPTRELATQIASVVKELASNVSGHKKQWNIVVLHGGVPREPQMAALAECSNSGTTIDVLVATPGRLIDVLKYYSGGDSAASDAALEKRLLAAMDARGRKADQSLSLDQIQKLQLDRLDDEGRASLPAILDQLDFLVLDEADRLLGRTFETEMDGVLDLLPSIPSTWLFSATFPKHVEPRVDAVLKRIGSGGAPVRISCTNSDRSLQSDEDVSASLSKKLERTQVQQLIQQVGPASTIALRTIRLEKRDRTQALRVLLEQQPDWDRVLVFVATRYSAEHVSRKLRRAGIESSELHGKLDQDARTRRLQDFVRGGKIRVLLATDVASRGLDIVGLPAVINYDLPRSPADFVHRVGRTGRAGLRGTAVTFLTPDSEAHLDLIEKRYLAEPVEREVLAGCEPDEEQWRIEAEGSRLTVPGAVPSDKGLAHDRMFGGIKSRRKSKKDKLREQQAATKAPKSTSDRGK